MSNEALEANRKKVQRLLARGDVEVLNPDSATIGTEVELENIESGVSIGPAAVISGSKTMIGAGTKIVGSAVIRNCLIGRGCTLQPGEYLDSVLLDGCSTVGWARVRGNSGWEEGSTCAHNVDTKTTLLGYKTTLGSLINFCNVLMLGGTSPRLEVGAEVGSGTINFNFLPFGPTVGALIKPSTVIGSMESPFLSCDGAPVRYDFIGGHTSIIAPVVIGLNSVVAAKTRVNPGLYRDDVMIGGGNLDRTTVTEVSRVRVLKDIRPKYRILVRQLGIAASYRRWCALRVEWAEESGLDEFEIRLIRGFAEKVDLFYKALEDYGDNIARYLLADDGHSRADSLELNKEAARRWSEELKPRVRSFLSGTSGHAEATAPLKASLQEIAGKPGSGKANFYDLLSKLQYSSPAVASARAYFAQLEKEIISSAAI